MGIYTIIVSRWHNGVRTFAIRDGYESDTYLIPFIVKQDSQWTTKGVIEVLCNDTPGLVWVSRRGHLSCCHYDVWLI